MPMWVWEMANAKPRFEFGAVLHCSTTRRVSCRSARPHQKRRPLRSTYDRQRKELPWHAVQEGAKKVSFIPRPRIRSRGCIDGGEGLGDYENIFPKSLETTEPGFWAKLWRVWEFRELFLSAFFSSRRSGTTMWPVVLLLG